MLWNILRKSARRPARQPLTTQESEASLGSPTPGGPAPDGTPSDNQDIRNAERNFRRTYETATSTLQIVKTACRQLTEKNRELSLENSRAAKRLHSAHSKLQSLETQFDNHLKHCNTQTHELRGAVEKLQAQLTQAEVEQARLQEVVRIAQEGALRSLKRDQQASIEDQEVRQRFSRLEEKLRVWTRKYAIEDTGGLEPALDSNMNEIIEWLSGYCAVDSWSDLQSALPSIKKKLSLLLLQATLAKSIFGTAFDNPFFVFPLPREDVSAPTQFQMLSLYNILKEVNEADGHTWRSKTLRTMRNSAEQSTSDAMIASRLKYVSDELAATIFNGVTSTLLRPLPSDSAKSYSAQELEKIIYDVLNLAFTLWTQNNFITCHALEKLDAFKAESDLMIPHRLHRLDEDDSTFDGQPIILVTHPLILAFGDDNAENYDQHKFWTKAVVCVEEPGSIQQDVSEPEE